MTIAHIDETRLETDNAYRFAYVSEFMEFGAEDIAAIHAVAAYLGPLVPSLVDAVYDKLFSYDATKRHFIAKQSGYEGPVPENIDSLGQDHPVVIFRKQHLGRYLTRLVTGAYDGEMVEYLDLVGKIHTPAAGSQTLFVPLVQMNALLGFVSTALLSTIVSCGLERETEIRTLQAFHKLLWIQNDFISRHYQFA